MINHRPGGRPRRCCGPTGRLRCSSALTATSLLPGAAGTCRAGCPGPRNPRLRITAGVRRQVVDEGTPLQKPGTRPGAPGAALARAVPDARRRHRAAEPPLRHRRSARRRGPARRHQDLRRRRRAAARDRRRPPPASRCSSGRAHRPAAPRLLAPAPSPGLPNRTHPHPGLAASLAGVAEGWSPGAAVLLLDLDGFKPTSTRRSATRRATACLGQPRSPSGSWLLLVLTGTTARLGGDEFAVLIPGTVDADCAVHLCPPPAASPRAVPSRRRVDCAAGCLCLGWRWRPSTLWTRASLLKRADLAMSDAKTSHLVGSASTTPRLDADKSHGPHLGSPKAAQVVQQDPGRSTSSLKSRLRPVMVKNGWEHRARLDRARGVRPIAKSSGLIGRLTTQVLETPLAACARWRAAGHDLCVAVNLSPPPSLGGRRSRRRRRPAASPAMQCAPADRLTLEVTEGSVMADPDRAVAVLQDLRALGARLLVDDS